MQRIWKVSDGDRIAVLYAQGDITSGKGDKGSIGSDNFKNIIRKLRLDDDVKAIVFRVNSPGGSALASDVIWHEIFTCQTSQARYRKHGRLCSLRRLLYFLRGRQHLCRCRHHHRLHRRVWCDTGYERFFLKISWVLHPMV